PLRGDFEAHSADALDAFTAGAHFAASAATNLAASSSDCGAGTSPMPWMRSLRSGELTAPTISAFSFCSTSRGVPAVVKSPYHPYASKPGRPDSATVGTSGICGERFAPDTASILIRPLWTNCAKGPSALKVKCTSPETSSGAACWMPLYGTCDISRPAAVVNSTAARCVPLPTPTEA